MIEKLIKNELTLKRWRSFKRRKLAVASCFILIGMLLATFLSPFLANSRPIVMKYKGKYFFPVTKNYHPRHFGIKDLLSVDYRNVELASGDFAIWPPIKWDPYESNESVDQYPSPPSGINHLGTDDRGRDVLTRLLYGFKYSITYSVVVWLLTTIMGAVFGAIMGFFGGKIDFLGQRTVEVLQTVPQFFILLTLISIYRPNLPMLIIVSCTLGWIGMSYYIRAEFLKNRKREFVEAAKSLGASTPSILFKHMLPNSLTPIITFAPFIIAGGISALAGLDYLGFGLPVPTPSWGELLNQAQKNFTTAWWLAFYPSVALFSTLFLLSIIGSGIRDAIDPNA
jgi:microcin C transport system permease protein